MNTGRQSVQLVRGVVSDKDGMLGLTIYDTENSKTSNTVLDVSDNPEYWCVPAVPVVMCTTPSIAAQYDTCILSTVMYCIRCTVSDCTVLNCITSYCIVLYCAVLCHSPVFAGRVQLVCIMLSDFDL